MQSREVISLSRFWIKILGRRAKKAGISFCTAGARISGGRTVSAEGRVSDETSTVSVPVEHVTSSTGACSGCEYSLPFSICISSTIVISTGSTIVSSLGEERYFLKALYVCS